MVLNLLAGLVLFVAVVDAGKYTPAYLFILGYLMALHHRGKRGKGERD